MAIAKVVPILDSNNRQIGMRIVSLVKIDKQKKKVEDVTPQSVLTTTYDGDVLL